MDAELNDCKRKMSELKHEFRLFKQKYYKDVSAVKSAKNRELDCALRECENLRALFELDEPQRRNVVAELKDLRQRNDFLTRKLKEVSEQKDKFIAQYIETANVAIQYGARLDAIESSNF